MAWNEGEAYGNCRCGWSEMIAMSVKLKEGKPPAQRAQESLEEVTVANG